MIEAVYSVTHPNVLEAPGTCSFPMLEDVYRSSPSDEDRNELAQCPRLSKPDGTCATSLEAKCILCSSCPHYRTGACSLCKTGNLMPRRVKIRSKQDFPQLQNCLNISPLQSDWLPDYCIKFKNCEQYPNGSREKWACSRWPTTKHLRHR